MADQVFGDAGSGTRPENSALVPAASVQRAGVPVTFRSGLGRPAPSRGLDAMSLLRSFRRRWPLALGLGLTLSFAVAAVAWFVIPATQYTSRSILRMHTHAPTIIFETAEKPSDYRTFQRTQAEMIKSPVVIEPALRDPRVMNLPVVVAQADPKEWLEKEIHVDFGNGSELLFVSMSSVNPDELEPIVNAVVDAYLETVVLAEHKVREARLDNLRKLLSRYQEELKGKRRLVREMANAVGTENRETVVLKQGFLMEDLQTLQRDLLAVKAELRRFASYSAVIDKKNQEAREAAKVGSGVLKPDAPAPAEGVLKQAATLAIDSAIAARIEADPGLHALRQDHDTAFQKWSRLRSLSRKQDDPAAVAARSKYLAAKQNLADHKERLRDVYLTEMTKPDASGGQAGATGAQSGPSNVSSMARFQDQVAILKRNEEDLVREIEKYRQEIGKFNSQTIDLKTEQDEIAVTDQTAQQIGKEVEALEVELTAPKRITRVSKAEPARKKNPAKRYLICGGASFGALALAVLGVSFWDMRAMRIDSLEEVTNDLGLAIVGTLPALPNRGKKLSKSDDQRWQGLLIESIDATRTMLLHASRVNSTRAVMITSAMKGEGKTSLAAHLATSLARAGRKTLLIDCDLRRPTLHQLLDVARVPGLCELLRGEAEMADVIRPTPADDLNLMPAGHCDNVALQAIAQDGFRDVLTVLKKRYDFIIIDSAPVLPVVDTMLLSQQVDAVLFSIMRDVSRVPHVQAAHDRIASLGVQMLGAVVNAAKRSDYMHSYNYKYDTAESA